MCPILTTHLLPRHCSEHELRICHHCWCYRVILVRTPTPTSLGTLTSIFGKTESGTSLGALLFFNTGNVTYRLTAFAAQGDTIKAPFRTPGGAKSYPKVTIEKTSPMRKTQALLWSECSAYRAGSLRLILPPARLFPHHMHHHSL